MKPLGATVWRLLLFFTLSIPLTAAAQEPAAAEPAPAIDPEAMKILAGMADFLGKSQTFSVVMRTGYDAVQESGQKIEFGAVRRISLERPSGLRAEVEESNGERSIVTYDGKDLTILDEARKVFARAPVEGGVDAAVKHFVGELRMRLPLAVLLLSSLRPELERRIESLAYVEESTVMGVRCDHLAARTKDVDFQAWIQQGDKPLLLRVVITYKQDPGAPQFWAQISDWNFKPAFPKNHFTFTPPGDANQIQFAAQLMNAAGQTGAKP